MRKRWSGDPDGAQPLKLGMDLRAHLFNNGLRNVQRGDRVCCTDTPRSWSDARAHRWRMHTAWRLMISCIYSQHSHLRVFKRRTDEGQVFRQLTLARGVVGTRPRGPLACSLLVLSLALSLQPAASSHQVQRRSVATLIGLLRHAHEKRMIVQGAAHAPSGTHRGVHEWDTFSHTCTARQQLLPPAPRTCQTTGF